MGNDVLLLLDGSQLPTPDLRGMLARCGFGVRIAADTETAGRIVEQGAPALVLVRAARGGGAELCRSARALCGAPVVAVCAADDRQLAVRCLNAGADTVLSWPISRRELAARLHALLRPRQRTHASAPVQSYRIGDLTIDRGARLVRRLSRHLSVTPTEFRLLLALASRAGTVVSYRDLISEVWGPDSSDSSKNLRLYVRYLRRKLQDDQRAPRLLLNQRGIGYKLAADVEKGQVHGDHEDAHAGTHRRLREGRTLAPVHG